MIGQKLMQIGRKTPSQTLQFRQLPINLTCVKCRNVLKDARQLQCGCRFCLNCVNTMKVAGYQFCPGVTENCEVTPLSTAAPDYRANNSISKLPVRCSNKGCLHECSLADMTEHLRVCEKKTMPCTFHELGCKQDKLIAEELSGHLQRENRAHSDLLVGIVGNITNELSDNKREIDKLKRNEQTNKQVMETMKHDLDAKERRIAAVVSENESIKDQMESIVEKNKSLRNEMESIRNEMESIRNEMRSIESVNKFPAGNMHSQCPPPPQPQSVRTGASPADGGPIDARIELVIDDDVEATCWGWAERTSAYFSGATLPYKYRLACGNYGSVSNVLEICLRLHPGASDSRLPWPFRAQVTVTVTDRDRRDLSMSESRRCTINRPPGNCCRSSDNFVFPHALLIDAGIRLDRGVCISCTIAPSSAKTR